MVVKLCGDGHRPQDRAGPGAAAAWPTPVPCAAAAAELLAAARPDDGAVTLLVAPMVAGNRELIAGLVRDPQFGLNVMLGVGGILAEAVGDVVFCPVPAQPGGRRGHDRCPRHARRCSGRSGAKPAVDRERLADVLAGLSALAGGPAATSSPST